MNTHDLDAFDNIARSFAKLGVPLDALDTRFMGEAEREVWYRACRSHSVKHSDEINAYHHPMTSADLIRANID